MWTCSPWALLPPIYSLLTAAGLWAVYFLAVDEEKIVPLGSKYRGNGSFYPPYISIAGNFPPASCIFSEVMNLAAFVGFVIAALRYLQLRQKMDKQWLNVGSLAAFSVGCFGMTLVGNFQLFTEETMHNFGTFLTFILGTLFCWVQSYVTLRVNLRNEGRKAAALRFLLSGSITLCMILCILRGDGVKNCMLGVFFRSCCVSIVAPLQDLSLNSPAADFSLMAQGLHVHAAQCQWALVMFFLAFLATFAIEFRHSHFQVVCTERSASRHQPDGL